MQFSERWYWYHSISKRCPCHSLPYYPAILDYYEQMALCLPEFLCSLLLVWWELIRQMNHISISAFYSTFSSSACYTTSIFLIVLGEDGFVLHLPCSEITPFSVLRESLLARFREPDVVVANEPRSITYSVSIISIVQFLWPIFLILVLFT